MNKTIRNTVFIIVIFLTTIFIFGCSNTPKHKEIRNVYQKINSFRLNDSTMIKIHLYNKFQYDSIDNRWYFIEYVIETDTTVNKKQK